MRSLRQIECTVLAAFVLVAAPVALSSAELPEHYFKLMETELRALGNSNSRSVPGAMFAAAVLYSKQHSANPAYGDQEKLALALKLGDRFAEQSEADTSENKQDYE